MAVVHFDGFDHYATANIPLVYTIPFGASPEIQNSAPMRRTGSKYLAVIYPYGAIRKSLTASTSGIIVGVAMYNGALPGGQIEFYDDTTCQVSVQANTDGRIEAWNGLVGYGTLLGTSAEPVVSATTWHYVESRVTFSAAAGVVEVKVNGVQVLYLSNVDTIATANAYATAVQLKHGAVGYYARYDDFYIVDTTALPNNSFLGDCRVDTMYPNQDVSPCDFTPLHGGDNYAEVDDDGTIDEDTTYNYANVVDSQDTFNVEDPAELVGETIYAIAVNWTARKDDAGTRVAKPFVIANTTQDFGDEKSLGDSYLQYQHIWETNPHDGLPWEPGDAVNGLQIGYYIES